MQTGYVKKFLIIMTVLLMMSASRMCHAENEFYERTSGAVFPFVLTSELILTLGHDNGKEKAVQGAKALVVTALATDMLKHIVREKRPNGESRMSFPSGHTSIAFAAATVLSDYKPRYTIPAYGIAILIGWSRVELKAHHWYDVLAGAVLGYSIAKRYTGQRLTVTPDGVTYNWQF
ncbi:MAG: phosphatase PAP2 family protein [Armatimonadota bacterium]